MPREWERKETDSNKNLLLIDIGVRIAEAANAFGELASELKFPQGYLSTRFVEFYKAFIKLFDQTVEQLEEEDREELKGQIEKWIAKSPPVKEVDGQRQVDITPYAQEGLDLYREYKEAMRECGILDLGKYGYKQRTYGGKKRVSEIKNKNG